MSVRQPRPVAVVLTEMLAIAPDGFASSHDPDDFLGARFRPIANEFATIEASALSMLPEIDPRSAPHLLPDWQRMLGPDPCMANAGTLDVTTQGNIAYAKLTNAGTICAGYFERQALTIGETIAIQEYPQSMCGWSICGGGSLVPSPLHCTFLVTLGATHVVTAICGSTDCGESLGSFTPSVMECVVRNGAPLFTTPYFHYS